MSRIFGYARVSSKDQNEERQMIALEKFGVKHNRIFVEKISGKDFDRPTYKALLSKLRPHDVLAVMSIDRLGRNYDDIIEQWRLLTKEMQVDIVVLDMPLLDTRNKDKDLLGTFVADLVLQILSYVAQTERESIHERQRQGIEAAQLKGVRFGRPPIKIPPHFYTVAELWSSAQISSRIAAEKLGVAQSTFLRWAKKAYVKQEMVQ